MDDKKRILEMLAEKKITSEEAVKLLSAVDEKKVSGNKLTRCLRITVYENDREKPKVNVSIPVMLVKLGAKFIPKDKMNNTEVGIGNSNFDLSGIDWDELLKLASKGELGDIFNAEIEEDNGKIIKVHIFIE